MARPKPACMAFMQADPVEGTDSEDRFVRDDLGFNQERVAGPVADDLGPDQSPLKPFKQANLLDDRSRDQVVFQNVLELIAREDGRKIESALNRKSVSLTVGHNLQLQPFSEEDHDLLPVPLGKLASKGGFNFLDDFGCGKSVSAG